MAAALFATKIKSGAPEPCSFVCTAIRTLSQQTQSLHFFCVFHLTPFPRIKTPLRLGSSKFTEN